MSRPVEEPQQSTSDADDGPTQPASVPIFVETAAAALSSDETRSENPKYKHDDFLKDDVPTLVRNGLYIGSVDAAENLPGLKFLNITHVLQVAQLDVEHRHPGVEYMVLSVMDENEVDLVTHFERCFEFIDRGRAAGGVLVHCVAGVSRSATVCLGYLMSHEQLRYPEAWSILQKARPWVNPNEGFQAQLREFERLGADPTRWAHSWPDVWGSRGKNRSVFIGS